MLFYELDEGKNFTNEVISIYMKTFTGQVKVKATSMLSLSSISPLLANHFLTDQVITQVHSSSGRTLLWRKGGGGGGGGEGGRHFSPCGRVERILK